MIESLGDKSPKVEPNARVHPSAVVAGDVTLEQDVSIWPCAVLRGDYDWIRIGRGTNIQDGAVIHTDNNRPTDVGESCVVGHQACLHGCKVGNRALIGIHAVVLSGAVVGDESIVGAGSLVGEGKVIPPRSLVLGVPARVVRQLSDEDVAAIQRGAREYQKRAEETLPKAG